MDGKRSPDAALSSAEVNALRRVANGLANFLSVEHRDVLVSMGLIGVTLNGRFVLTEEGKQRLTEEMAARPTRAQTSNPSERPPGK